MLTSSDTKENLRKKYLKERSTFSKTEIEEYSLEIFQNFLKHFSVTKNQNIHIFLSIEKLNEINTSVFIEYFWQKECKVYVPKLIDNEIISLKLEPTTLLEQNSWGIKEPKGNQEDCYDFDFVITPLVYADNLGNRIGYGKGFYDQFFRKINTHEKKIGIGPFSPNEQISDISLQDVPLDYLVTPTEVLSFKGVV